MSTLKECIAVVAGGSRGAGRGIALALGEAGATVYVVGRSTRGGPRPLDGAPGTIEETADEVTARGGAGIPVRADCTSEPEVAELFERVRRDHGRLDLLANAVWGGHDMYASFDEAMKGMGRPFWQQPASDWHYMMNAGPYAYFLTSRHAVPLMTGRHRLIVGLTDGMIAGASEDACRSGQLVWELAHHSINRLMRAMSVEAKKQKVAVVTLMPGFMRTERVVRAMTTDKLKKMFRFDLSESTEYIGRAVVALAQDTQAIKKTGQICFVADLAKEYGFTDVDGREIPRFAPFG